MVVKLYYKGGEIEDLYKSKEWLKTCNKVIKKDKKKDYLAWSRNLRLV
jgi:hypothetical protein